MGDEDVLHRAEVVPRVRGVAAVLLDGHTELLRGLTQQTRGMSAMRNNPHVGVLTAWKKFPSCSAVSPSRKRFSAGDRRSYASYPLCFSMSAGSFTCYGMMLALPTRNPTDC